MAYAGEVFTPPNPITPEERAQSEATRREEDAKKKASLRTSFKTLGFRGIHLGMTAEELDYYMKESPQLGYADNSSAVNSDYIFVRAFTENDPLELGCDGAGTCYSATDLLIQLLDGKIISITLQSPKYSADYIESFVKDWGRFALKGLINKYGQPTKTYLPLDKVNIFKFENGFYYNLYEWNKGKEKILMVTTESEAQFGINIVFENIDGAKKYQKLKAKGAAEF